MNKNMINTSNINVSGFRITDVFHLLSDPTRFRIIHILSKVEEMCVSDIQNKTEVTLSAISHQLSILEAKSVVEKYRYGRTICYRINKKNPTAKKILRVLKVI